MGGAISQPISTEYTKTTLIRNIEPLTQKLLPTNPQSVILLYTQMYHKTRAREENDNVSYLVELKFQLLQEYKQYLL